MHHQSTLPLFTSEEIRYCAGCGEDLVRREGESPSDFKRRNSCNRSCRDRAHAKTWERKRQAYLAAGEKECTKCKRVKPLSAFRKSYGHPDALQPSCQECQRKAQRRSYWRDPEASRAAARIHARKNPEKQRERQRQYIEKNREALRRKWRAYHAANRERRRQYDRDRRAAIPVEERRAKWRAEAARYKASGALARYLEKNKEKRRAYQREWRRMCHVKNTAKENRRRARIKNLPTVEFDRAEIIARDRSTCYLCDRKLAPREVTLDHLIPVARGGPHRPDNLSVVCQPCNSRKRDRLPGELPEDMGRRVRRRIQAIRS